MSDIYPDSVCESISYTVQNCVQYGSKSHRFIFRKLEYREFVLRFVLGFPQINSAHCGMALDPNSLYARNALMLGWIRSRVVSCYFCDILWTFFSYSDENIKYQYNYNPITHYSSMIDSFHGRPYDSGIWWKHGAPSHNFRATSWVQFNLNR